MNDDRISCEGSEAKHLALDWDYLARQTFGDVGLEFELLCVFRAQAEVVLQRLRGSQPMADREKADFAHLLKGSARAIGAIRVGSACDVYEALLADSGRGADEALKDLAAAVAEAADEINQSLAKRSFEEQTFKEQT
ncbi:Hpt domain-containing protein [Methylocapsa polymorpha]|uniref:Hpt domain-containing protein n=1 Tax=Methylocapsa polymorpha TaxID=3080828 RepID=A0ABZ0HSU2_9HYPH|nr:Hpt domain-containing protein [Methylocapsa sp. RX1]